jgi:tetratricopeptide (TPR) repeat protein
MALSRFFLSSLLLLLFLNLRIPLPAQAGETVSLAAELGKAENLPQNPAEKYQALLHLARLLQLSGDPEQAAAAWLEAANAAPGGRDDRALLEGCRILIALGEYERAGEGIRAALAGGREKIRAEYLAALFDAFGSGDCRALVRMAGEADFASYRGEIYYTLWKISGGGQWKTRLLEEFPRSPEALIAADTGNVRAAATAHWFLFPGRESAAFSVPAPSAAASPVSTGVPGVFLQAGLYGREENAAAMAGRLKTAGFDARLRRRAVNGTGYWAVSVPPGPDMNKTIRMLKEAGFDSFPVYE